MDRAYRDVVSFVQAARFWLQEHNDDTKLRQAVKKVLGRCMKLLEAQAEQEEDIQFEHCSTDDKTKIILKDENGQLKFTKDTVRKKNDAIRALRAKPLDIVPIIVDEVPDDLKGTDRDAFAGFVLPAEPDDAAAVEAAE